MKARHSHIAHLLLAVVLAFLTSCAGAGATASPIPPTEKAAPPTATQAPAPTSSPTQAPTATAPPAPTIPPTPTAPPATVAASPTLEPETLPPAPFPGRSLADFVSDNFVGSLRCAVCHTFLTDEAGNDVSIDTHWRSTMMANAATDPLWLAKVSSEVERAPALRAVIEGKCVTCHMPMAHTQAVAGGEGTALFEGGFLDPGHALNEPAMDGVACALCHQIQDVDLGQEGSYSGEFTVDTDARPPDRPAFGPYPDPFGQVMAMHVGYTPVEGPHVRSAELCATCHTLFTPYVDASGNVLGTFPEQTPYLEWEHSIYGEKDIPCQYCHMPQAEGAVVISNMPPAPPLSPRSPFSQHHFVGGNTFMLNLFRLYGEDLGLTASSEQLDATLGRTLERLESKTARLSIGQARRDGDKLNLSVEVSSSAGHKFPTGFPSRRTWLHLTVTDAGGAVVFESGAPRPNGSIVGCDADDDEGAYEPHHERITSADQVQIYETVMQNSDEEVTYTLLRGASYAKDNRLLPAGFDKETAPRDIAVLGAAAQDEDFAEGADQVRYEIDVGGAAVPLTVSVELLYQSVSYRFVTDLRQEGTALVEQFIRYYDDLEKLPVRVASDQKTVR